MIYGDNRFEVILYGPQGQQRSRLEHLNVGQEQVPPGQTWYWAGVSQPGKDMLSEVVKHDEVERQPGDFTRPDLQAGVHVEHGLDKKTSVGLLATMLLAGNEKLGGIPAVRSPAETDRFVREQYQLYERLADRLGLRQ